MLQLLHLADCLRVRGGAVGVEVLQLLLLCCTPPPYHIPLLQGSV
jgi:hypothetical protein